MRESSLQPAVPFGAGTFSTWPIKFLLKLLWTDSVWQKQRGGGELVVLCWCKSKIPSFLLSVHTANLYMESCIIIAA